MKIRKLTALLAAFVLLTAASAKEGKKEAVKKLSNTRIASCLVKVTCDPAVLPLRSLETIDQLLNSSGVAGGAAREILQIPVIDNESMQMVSFRIDPLSDEPKDMSKGIEFDEEYERELRALGGRKQYKAMMDGPTYASEQTLFFRLAVELEHNVKPAAEEFMKALLDNLRKTLDAAFDDYRNNFNQQLDFANDDVQHAERDLAGLQEKLREILGTYNLERKAILDDISRSRKHLQATKMELETSEAFIEATSKRIVKTEAKMNDKINSDPVLAELQKIVKIHEERLKPLMRKGTPEELSQARELLLRAKIELAERREEIRESAGGSLIDSLRNQISELTIERAQASSRISNLEIQLVEASDLLERADAYERFSLRLKIAKQTLEESLLLHSRMKRKSLLIQPSVVVFGAD